MPTMHQVSGVVDAICVTSMTVYLVSSTAVRSHPGCTECLKDIYCTVQIASGRTLTEVDVDLELTARRSQQPGFVSLSFATIAGK